jgi:hypothetical protein
VRPDGLSKVIPGGDVADRRLAFIAARLAELDTAPGMAAWVTAVRTIVALHQRRARRVTLVAPRYYCDCQAPDGIIEDWWPCDTIAAVCAIWPAHPDYVGREVQV